jgi:plasmid maintenance system antidote protein VapI
MEIEDRVSLSSLRDAVLDHVRLSIRNGEWTERGLARAIGVSQPHLHHVLNGKRQLQFALADRLIVQFGIDLRAK